MRLASEASAADRILIEQLSTSDQRPIDLSALEQETERLRTHSGCRSQLDDPLLQQFVERQLRVQRFRAELVADAGRPEPEEVEAFYNANAANFQQPEMFRASHIVKYVNESQPEEAAMVGIRQAEEQLEHGAAFSEVAGSHSDCSDADGDLGEFPAGFMVPEFEEVIRTLEPGQRSGIFRTPFGFHIALLRSKKPAGAASFERVRSDIERVMLFSKQHETYVRKFSELRAQAEIQFVPASYAESSHGRPS
jgi:parvulin-like peptidyl-prolyl isomerase